MSLAGLTRGLCRGTGTGTGGDGGMTSDAGREIDVCGEGAGINRGMQRQRERRKVRSEG